MGTLGRRGLGRRVLLDLPLLPLFGFFLWGKDIIFVKGEGSLS